MKVRFPRNHMSREIQERLDNTISFFAPPQQFVYDGHFAMTKTTLLSSQRLRARLAQAKACFTCFVKTQRPLGASDALLVRVCAEVMLLYCGRVSSRTEDTRGAFSPRVDVRGIEGNQAASTSMGLPSVYMWGFRFRLYLLKNALQHS